jgi:hypothetical protein
MIHLLCVFSLSVSDTPYKPDIKVGIIKRADKCSHVVTETCLVYCHFVATIEGQPVPIIDTKRTGKPISFRMASKRIIPGIAKGLLGACRGEMRRITIPPALAYGEGSIDGLFPPDSTWIADVEVVDVVDSAEH